WSRAGSAWGGGLPGRWGGARACSSPGTGGESEVETAPMAAGGGAGGGVGAMGVVLLSCRIALAVEPWPAEVRVLSNPAPLPNTLVTVRATPGTVVEDRTVGAKPAAAGQGPASTGETFRDEI